MKKFGFPVNLRPLVINLSLSFLVYINDGWNVPLIVCACAIFPKTIKSSKFFPMVLISPFFENCEIFFSVENCQFSENRKIINENLQSRFVVSQKLQWDNRTQNKILKKLVCLPAFQEYFHLSLRFLENVFIFWKKVNVYASQNVFWMKLFRESIRSTIFRGGDVIRCGWKIVFVFWKNKMIGEFIVLKPIEP